MEIFSVFLPLTIEWPLIPAVNHRHILQWPKVVSSWTNVHMVKIHEFVALFHATVPMNKSKKIVISKMNVRFHSKINSKIIL